LANFVGSVVGFLNVLLIRLRSLLLAAALSFESKWHYTLVRLEGFELSAHGLEVRCSIQLSYRRIFLTMCQKDLASYRLRLLLSRLNADEIANNLKLARTG